MAEIKKILPPSAARIAQEAGPSVKQRYDEYGLTCFREEFVLGESEQVFVREGYIDEQELPNGTILSRKVITKTITRAQAEEEA